jgi:hypothetical protein
MGRREVLASSVTDNPRIAFVGTGAQGASIGADFALAGFDVTFIEQWPAHIEAIREKGITVNLPARTINAKVPALHFCQVAEIKEKFDPYQSLLIKRDVILKATRFHGGPVSHHRGRSMERREELMASLRRSEAVAPGHFAGHIPAALQVDLWSDADASIPRT